MMYRIVDRDAGNEKIIEADSMQDAIARAREWARSGDYDEPTLVRLKIEPLDEDGDLRNPESAALVDEVAG